MLNQLLQTIVVTVALVGAAPRLAAPQNRSENRIIGDQTEIHLAAFETDPDRHRGGMERPYQQVRG
jgi:hypothetical protein